MYRRDIRFAINLMDDAATAFKKLQLRQDIGLRPREPSAYSFLGVIVAAAANQSLNSCAIGNNEIYYLQIIPLKELHHVVKPACLVVPAGKTVCNYMLFTCKIFHEQLRLEIDCHKVIDTDAVVYNFAG